MRIGVAILTSGLLIGCGLGYQNSQIDRRPEQAYGVGATIINPGEASPATRMSRGSAGSSQTSNSSSPGQRSGSSTSSGNAPPPAEEDLTMIGGQSSVVQGTQTSKRGPAFLPVLGYPFWFLGKSLSKKADRAVEREARKQKGSATPEMPPVETPDDAERARLQQENALLREQLRRSPSASGEAPARRSSIADELAALQRSLPDPLTNQTSARAPLTRADLSPPETADRNADGRADLWVHTESGGRVRESLDENHDGRVDRVLYYDSKRRLQRSEEDLDGDGVMETVALFRDGHVVRRRTDSDGDGQSDAWSFYRDGELVRHEIDRDGDGFRDLVLSYGGGELIREEEDRDGDGRPDKVTSYRNGEVVTVREDLDHDGVTDVESTYERGKLVRRDLNSEHALRTWGSEAQP